MSYANIKYKLSFLRLNMILLIMQNSYKKLQGKKVTFCGFLQSCFTFSQSILYTLSSVEIEINCVDTLIEGCNCEVINIAMLSRDITCKTIKEASNMFTILKILANTFRCKKTVSV